MTDRSNLGFTEAVEKQFGFLLEFGMEVAQTETTLVVYRGVSVEVDIFHGRQSYEVGGGVTTAGVRYSASEIIKAASSEANYCQPTVTTREDMTQAVRHLAQLMQRYTSPALTGNPEFFALLATQRREQSRRYMLEVSAPQKRQRAEHAFVAGDYTAAAALYGEIRELLTETELERLAFAEKHRT